MAEKSKTWSKINSHCTALRIVPKLHSRLVWWRRHCSAHHCDSLDEILLVCSQLPMKLEFPRPFNDYPKSVRWWKTTASLHPFQTRSMSPRNMQPGTRVFMLLIGSLLLNGIIAVKPLNVHGLVAAVFTPFDSNLEMNLSVVPDQAAFLQKTGVAYAFIGGTTGESVSLSLDERQSLLEKWIKIAPDYDLQIIVGSECLSFIFSFPCSMTNNCYDIMTGSCRCQLIGRNSCIDAARTVPPLSTTRCIRFNAYYLLQTRFSSVTRCGLSFQFLFFPYFLYFHHFSG